MRAMTVIAIIACSAQTAFATIQVSDTVVLGGRTYEIQEIPMLGLWDHGEGSVGDGKQKRPKFEATNSANWVGYRAKFEIRDSKFYLRKIVGQIDGKKRKNEEIIVGKEFPIVAEWFSGRIHLEVGDYDSVNHEATSVIIFSVENGIVTKTEFAERMKRIQTWNGMPDTAP